MMGGGSKDAFGRDFVCLCIGVLVMFGLILFLVGFSG